MYASDRELVRIGDYKPMVRFRHAGHFLNVVPSDTWDHPDPVRRKIAVVNIFWWIKEVATPQLASKIYPKVFRYTPQAGVIAHADTVECGGEFFAYEKDKYALMDRVPRMELGAKMKKELELMSFFIVQLDFLLDDALGHDAFAFFYREDKTGVWYAVVCDPNNALDHKAMGGIRSARALFEILLGEANVKHNRVQLNRCVNVNVCVSDPGTGLCYTGLCATLVATAMETSRSGKASTAEELMSSILEGSHAARDLGRPFVEAYHAGVMPMYHMQDAYNRMLQETHSHERSPSRLPRKSLLLEASNKKRRQRSHSSPRQQSKEPARRKPRLSLQSRRRSKSRQSPRRRSPKVEPPPLPPPT